VTGATPYAARPLARELGIDHVVCTELELDGGCFTGQVVPPLGYGHGKVTLAERLAERLGFSLEDSVFYTDSITDLPLLERVRERVIVNPDARLRRLARERGWPVEQW
jgi:phosphoserine phosphatase